ncbi:hypothetical protein A2899_03390 [Candidatus Amesbacteria bacterium RIFCSPLOWO2_01_FULL_49_25]|uniref:HTH deoR-type domain-containing protein n=1 Tax=Candidatus Amesbacteria bacterium RIFCSPHIGHO2_01_FULL_48_32b TaxID=1797253 RepID=A0A1F4YEG8_9BACT|nr:MAG: hypothetical protein A2876_02270 [Candidatus Amesbacteria bacterium RIFCSPHIGHO2_01_FULL_48_32b]OGD06915.1 MAG: hypothetical protein A2899_03390 [Candidatus Amesbacteria bacterium RIFCSPLOWO2_01_FULL_49_25]
MIIFSYNLSPTLEISLKKIDKLKSQILLVPLSPLNYHRLVWSATLSHLSGWAQLSNQPLSPQAIEQILLGPGDNRTSTPFIKKALDYRRALDHIWYEWTANPKSPTTLDLKQLANILGVSFHHEEEVTSLLGYVQTGPVHPAIQSAILHLYFYPSRLAYLASLLILYKSGFDLNRLLAMENYWNEHKTDYLKVLQSATRLGQITLWLEFYCTALVNQMDSLLSRLSQPAPSNHPLSGWQLSDRQKSILSLIEIPGSTITNQKVQSHFRVSQVTASRDLAKLSTLNFVIPHGHGRSTSYSLA